MKFNKALLEYYGVDPARVPDFEEFWALYATSFYERLFKRMDDPERMQQIYMKYMGNPKLDRRDKAALTFFYNIRRDELDDPNYWDKVGRGSFEEINKNESKTPMKAKLVKESLNEYYDPEPDELSKAKMEARRISREEGVSQHVNEIRPGVYKVEDWYDSDSTVASFHNGLQESLNESMSRFCGIWKASNGKWYLDLASQEYGEYEDATTYGPFNSEDAAEKYLNNFSNPGSSWTDESGEQPPPTESPNGRPVQRPSGGGMSRGFYGGGYRRF